MEKYLELKKVYENNGFEFQFFDTVKEAKNHILEEIGKGREITIGGSVTIDEVGLYEDLKDQGNDVYWHWKSKDENKLEKDIYFTSSNAITEDGKLVNMDGVGNRVSSMINGFKQVYIIVGKNKLVKNYDEAIERIRKIAGPKNAKRLGLKTPCSISGECSDCSSPDRICRAETIIHRNPSNSNIKIYLIEEELGY